MKKFLKNWLKAMVLVLSALFSVGVAVGSLMYIRAEFGAAGTLIGLFLLVTAGLGWILADTEDL